MARLLSILLLLSVAGCGLQPSSVGPNVSQKDLVADDTGVVVIGLATNRVGGICSFDIGPAGSGGINGGIRTGWSDGDGKLVYGSKTLSAGAWDIYLISCGNALVRQKGESGKPSLFGATYAPIARFEVAAGDVVYLGDVAVENFGPLANVTVRNDPDAARNAFAATSPSLAASMTARPLQLLDATGKPTAKPGPRDRKQSL